MKISDYVEYTILKADTTQRDVEKICEEAIKNNFLGVCVPPYYVKYAKENLKNTTIKVVTVIGFPLGYNHTSTKIEEAQKSIEEGADEIDMVMNVASFKNGEYDLVQDEIEKITYLTHAKDKKIKIIIETALLSNEEIVKICQICSRANVDFVKTSTGFATAGAKSEHIRLIRTNLPSKIKIKASGGIKNKKFAEELIQAGADAIGTSSILNN